MRRHDDDAISHVDGFVNVVGDQEHGGAAGLPEVQHLILHAHARERVERAQRLIEQQHLGMINQRPGQGNALGHAAGKMMRVGVGKCFQANQTHEIVHFRPFLLEQAARDQAGLNVAGDGEPGEEVGILKNQTAFGAGAGDRIVADPKLAGVGSIKTGKQAQQRGLATAAGTDD